MFRAKLYKITGTGKFLVSTLLITVLLALPVMAIAKTAIIETPLGNISFDERGDAIGVGFSMYKVVNGVYVEQK